MKTILSFISALFISYTAFAGPLISGEQIDVGTPDSRGPLATHGIMSLPLGAAHVFDGDSPDLFLATTKYGTMPGLWVYRWVDTTKDGVPIFKRDRKIVTPFNTPYPPSGFIVQRKNGQIIGVWLQGGVLVWTLFDKEQWAFVETHRLTIEGLPRGASSIGLQEKLNGEWWAYLEIGDGTPYRTTKGSSRSPEYQPYKGNGIWHGGMPYSALYRVQVTGDGTEQIGEPKRISHRDRDVRFSMRRIAPVPITSDPLTHEDSRAIVFTGSAMGQLHCFAEFGDTLWNPRMIATDKFHVAYRHPTIYATPIVYSNSNELPEMWSKDERFVKLLVGGEGGVYFTEFNHKFIANPGLSRQEAYNGRLRPVLSAPIPALEAGAKLYGGTLPVPNVVDWDGDGALDIVAGNSEGLVLFMKNAGTNDAPKYLPGEPLYAGDEKIHVQPGYRLDIQGPGEARWGYTCPTVVDWNLDGKLDILMSDSTARHTVFMNVGKLKKPKLAPGRPLYYEGLDMYGTWRVQPGIAKMNKRMAYVALDDEDQFHLYWKVDNYNVMDGGKLRLENGDVIGANFLQGGGSGRLKITLFDWDQDGATDLIVGTPRHGSVPYPKTGLPQSLGLPGSAVLLLKNTGSDAEPKFTFPKLLTVTGKPVFLGQHACGPAVAPFRGDKLADLIVAEEEGRFRYYKREDIEFKDIADIDPADIPRRK